MCKLVVNLLLLIRHSDEPILHYSRLLLMVGVFLVEEVDLVLYVKCQQRS